MASTPARLGRGVPSVRVRPRVRDADRQRAVQACWRCRNRKSRCILPAGNKERARRVCQRCLKDRAECIFGNYPATPVEAIDDERAATASPHTPSRRDTLATTTASPHTTSPLFPNERQSTAPSAHASPDDLSPGQADSRDAAGDGPPQVQPSQRTRHQLAQLVVRNPHQTHFVGEISNGTFFSEVQDAVVVHSPENVRQDRNMSSEFVQSLDSDTADTDLLKAALAGFPPRSVAEFLVSTLFHSVEANYYYMDRVAFTKRLDTCYNQRLTPESVDFDAGFVSLVLMVFAMGSQFADLRAPPITYSTAASTSKLGPGAIFYVKTKPLLADVIARCSLESIQVCFLVGLFLLPTNTSDLSYIYHGMAVKMAISAGLHRKVGNTNLSQRVLNVRNRLWWSLYTSERRLTIILDRPETIREEDVDTPFPDATDELDLPAAWDNMHHLQASIRLTRIYNKTVRLGKMFDFADKEAEPRVADIRHELDLWLKNLPRRLQLSNLHPDSKSFRGAVHLHMTYNQVIISMGRATVLRRIQQRLRGAAASEGDTDDPLSPDVAYTDALAHDCVAAAYRIIDLLRILHLSKRLARFSFTDTNCCSTAAIIIIIHEIIRPHPLYETAVASVLQFMKHMATGCQNARYGQQLVQNLLVLVTAAMKAEDQSAQPGSAAAGDESRGQPAAAHQDGYQAWQSWLEQAENHTGSRQIQGQAGSTGIFPVSVPLLHEQAGATSQDWEASEAAVSMRGVSAGFSSRSGTADQMLSRPVYATGYMGTGSSGSNVFAGWNDTAEITYNWPDDLNFLGLSAFEGLEFPANALDSLPRPDF